MAIHHVAWSEFPPEVLRAGAVTVGNFDGVHRGHRALVAAARGCADRARGPAIAITFDPPPAVLLGRQDGPLRVPLTTMAERAAWLQHAGVDHVAILRTDAALLSLSPEAFFEDVLLRQFGAVAIVEGYDFRFGRARQGDVSLLRDLCLRHGMHFEEVRPLTSASGEPVSSSRIRKALLEGEIPLAEELLGRPYAILGRVATGAQRGRTLGFPTANLEDVMTLVPAVGVYAVRVEYQGQTYHGASNIGPNPTFGELARKIEVHLLDFAGDLYGKTLEVTFLARLRSTRPFASVDELVAQLQRDIAAVRQIQEASR